MRRSSSSLALALCCSLGLSAPASLAVAQEVAQADAVVLFEQSAEAYRAGRFTQAATLLEEAYAIWPDPVLVYNLGRAYEGAGRLAEAREAYTRYLASGAVDDEADVRARLLALEQEAPPEVPAEPAAQPAAEVASSSPSELDSWAPWIITGASALVAVLGVGLIAAGAERAGFAQSEPVHLEASRALDDARALTGAGDVLLTVGLLGAAAGATWGLLSALGVLGGGGEDDRASLRVGLASATWRLRW